METKTIGSKIAKARKRVNISQAQLAQGVFVSPQAVGKWERGESIPDIITLNRLAGILEVDLNYFSEGTVPVDTETPLDDMVKQPAETPAGKQRSKPGWDMSYGNWVDADFSGLKDLHEKFSSSNMQRCMFIGAHMPGLLLKSNNVDSCDFSNSDISGSHFLRSHLAGNLFVNCSMTDAEFSESQVKNCNFTGGDLTGATFRSGGFLKNTMTDTVLNRTAFMGMLIDDIVFDGTLNHCYFENCAFKRVTFQNSTLINTFFKNKSLKHIRFIECQADRMTYEFLKNGKADVSGITVLTS